MNATEMGRAEETAVLMIYKKTGQETAFVCSVPCPGTLLPQQDLPDGDSLVFKGHLDKLLVPG